MIRGVKKFGFFLIPNYLIPDILHACSMRLEIECHKTEVGDRYSLELARVNQHPQAHQYVIMQPPKCNLSFCNCKLQNLFCNKNHIAMSKIHTFKI
jgi:hypothetical protein